MTFCEALPGKCGQKGIQTGKNALFSYTGNGYARINDLRKGKSNAKAKQIAKVIDRCKVPQDMVVFRGCGVYKELKDALNWKGEEITDRLAGYAQSLRSGKPSKTKVSCLLLHGGERIHEPSRVVQNLSRRRKPVPFMQSPFPDSGQGPVRTGTALARKPILAVKMKSSSRREEPSIFSNSIIRTGN